MNRLTLNRAASTIAAMTSSRSIVCVIPDLFFAVKVENLARQHGLALVTPQHADEFRSMLTTAALALIDTGAENVPWADWVKAAKADPAARHTPIITFGSHVDAAARDRALAAGANRYLARSNFVNGLPEIIARAARDLTDDPCSESLPEGAVRGIDEFNAGEYFEQHETLESVWRAEMRPVRDLYRGILQIGLALLQIERGNAPGARKMFERAFRWLEPFRPTCQGVDVERLLAESRTVYDEATRLGPERLALIKRAIFPQVHLIQPPRHKDTKIT
ncbi:MAG TPA: DUF309 domain-containing protein [Anaerolineae bacterium]